MQQFQIIYKNETEFENKLKEIKNKYFNNFNNTIFYITWTENYESRLQSVTQTIEKYFSGALFYGNEASGCISHGELVCGINVTCCIFDCNSTKTELVWVEKNTDISSLNDLWKYCNAKENLRAIEMIPSMSYVEELSIDGNIPQISDEIFIFGGASVNYDNSTYDASIIASGHNITKNGMAVMLYFGENLSFSSNDILGWKGLGSLMEVTDSTGKFVKKIDGVPAYSVYEKYLNLSMEDRDTLVFPLIVEEDGYEYIRTPQAVLEDKSIQMFADIPKGTKVRIAYGDKNTILSNIYDKAKDIAELRPEAIKAYSCAARRLFWGDDEVGRETRILEAIAPVGGFYTGGEILRLGDKLRVLNQTLAIITFKELNSGCEKSPVVLETKTADKSLVSRLAYFTQKVSEEQENEHRQLLENIDIIEGLASEYTMLYLINLDTGTFKNYVANDRVSDMRVNLPKYTKYSDLRRVFINNGFVHPDYTETIVDFFDRSQKELENKKSVSTLFKRKYGNEYLWTKAIAVKCEDISEKPHSVILGFTECDEDVRREQEQQKKLQEALSTNLLVKSFTEEYTTVFLIDRDGTYSIVKNQNDNLHSSEEISFDELADNFANSAVYTYDREYFRNECKYRRMFEKTAERNAYTVEFRIMSSNDNMKLWCEMKISTISVNKILVAIRPNDIEILQRRVDEKLYNEYASIFLVDLNTDTFRFLSRNSESGFANVSGGIYSETINEYASRVHPDYRKEWYNYCDVNKVREILKKERRVEYTYPLEGIDRRWRRCILQVLDTEHGIPTTFIMTYLTIDEQRAAEFELSRQIAKQKAQLEQQQNQLEEALAIARAASKAKTNFLFNMSHDIRTPMNAILGYTDIAIRHYEDEQRVKDSLRKIKASGGHLLNLINDILEMSRIESGKLELTNKPVDIYSAIEGIDNMSRALAVKNSIDFETEVGQINNPYVYADELHINEVIINLISNAIKYTPNGGKVRYRVSQIGTDNDGKAVFRFEVSDSGIGMSEDFQNHLFEAFTREDNESVSRIEGAGLGLSIVKRIIDAVGGSISVQSKLKKGSTFIADIPFEVMDENSIEVFKRSKNYEKNLSEEFTLEGKRVLLVEDNEMNREIASEILSDSGIDVECAEDGEVAVGKIIDKGSAYFDFILMDIQMPVMNGYEATKAIRLLPGGNEIPIIAVSANAFEEDKQKAMEAGMNAHIAKPINVKTLFETMCELSK